MSTISGIALQTPSVLAHFTLCFPQNSFNTFSSPCLFCTKSSPQNSSPPFSLELLSLPQGPAQVVQLLFSLPSHDSCRIICCFLGASNVWCPYLDNNECTTLFFSTPLVRLWILRMRLTKSTHLSRKLLLFARNCAGCQRSRREWMKLACMKIWQGGQIFSKLI